MIINPSPTLDIGPNDLYISLEGALAWAKNFDKADPTKNTLWTVDPKIELPILYPREDKSLNKRAPTTVMQWWDSMLPRIGSKKSLTTKVDGVWQSITYQEYYDLVVKFALGLVRLGISERSAVSILGYNDPKWAISAYGSIFANCINCGHYITNTSAVVQQIIEHSDSEVICVDSQGQLDKVLAVWPNLPQLK